MRQTQTKKSGLANGEKKISGKKILIVEDERAMAKVLQLKLTKEGFITDTAFDGEVAISALGKEKYDLILLDLVMPKVDGFGVMQWLKNKSIKTPVIITSNLSQDVDAKRSKELGAVDYFIKSDIAISEVVERVKKVLFK